MEQRVLFICWDTFIIIIILLTCLLCMPIKFIICIYEFISSFLSVYSVLVYQWIHYSLYRNPQKWNTVKCPPLLLIASKVYLLSLIPIKVL